MKRRTEFPLSVRYSPTVKVEAPPRIVREGEDLLLTCAVTGNPLPPQVSWSRLNSSLPDRAEAQGNTLTIRRLNSADNGTYVCEVHTEMGSSTDQYTLVVYDVSTSAPSTLAVPDQSAVVEPRTSTSYTIVGGVLAVLVFVVICVLIVTVWFSMRQKGSYLTHEASRLDEHGEVCEAFINGNDSHDQKKEYFI
ncbi:cell adhesion molecule 4-like isoform X2 [Hypanus sabinus]|uniref:cell adhesion molecule 4-like isoform X2 n=1 Tax=Hypanus sabinus TaxID=79690 RepID=UPI0028C3FE1F|nr:cell adhesion molecule 4-like isoform X2 [Hypanus sabinus]